MQLITTDKNQIANIVAEAKEKKIEPMRWIDFSGFVGDIWFAGKLTWDQATMIKRWAFDHSFDEGIEYVFGAIVWAYKNDCIVY